MFHSNSRPDFFLFEKERSCGIVVHRVELEESDHESAENEPVLRGIAGECKLSCEKKKEGIDSKEVPVASRGD